MNFEEILLALKETEFATAVREGESLFPWLESFHVLAIVIVVGMIAICDMRLMGLPAHRKGVRQLMKDVLPWTWIAFVAAVITGFLLFSSQPVKYWALWEFKAKMAVIVLAGLNMLYFHIVTFRNIHLWDELADTPRAAKIAGVTSLCLWIGVVILGRVIGFVL